MIPWCLVWIVFAVGSLPVLLLTAILFSISVAVALSNTFVALVFLHQAIVGDGGWGRFVAWAFVTVYYAVDAFCGELDSLKQAILETNPYLFVISVLPSLLHTVFEFLAFKNDIQFWRSRKSLEGLSVLSVLVSVFTSLIVFLYTWDSGMNIVVKCSVFIGLLIELWKVSKCLNVAVDRANPWFGVIPRVAITVKQSYVESATKQYDQLAFKYLSWALIPLLAGYAVYSPFHLEQKGGWYSWAPDVLGGFLFKFGFLLTAPQLFINYKLKSVAHLPWRVLGYKFINTFIDSLFSFVFHTPSLCGDGCFGDGYLFLIFLYQRWLYRVDPNRVNEVGTLLADSRAEMAATEGAGDGQLVEENSGEATE